MNKKVQLILLALVFFFPFILATILFYGGVTPVTKTKNHGILLSPPLATSSLIENSNRHWKLALLNADSCQQTCQQQLFLLRQIQTSLGKYQSRLDYLLLSSAALISDQQVLQLHPKLKQQKISQQQMSQLAQAIDTQQQSHLVLIDPLGNLLMKWSITQDELPQAGNNINSSTQQKAKSILSDIKHLLKISRIG